ncbi:MULTISPECIES: hypothetical protein [Bradyrhizobium]|uniref:Uncharacterized protein n=1 Tax=Bradyrhizobium symbiodeficiens TaxID=1404367 RepID=A0ABX5WCM1_9BRAD|nr:MULTISPECIES: hypothetical protein [Bradyrhizobium]QDF40467.1 hypothetical protein FJN17_24445 [Bradyrhizobium symbiodeficiens]QIP02908.1 hypothetical protein HAU86_25345 [Bradyrhizobium symbiodeficiens]UPJ59404.1 hypothetical protein IVB24_06230 [Bradyrhizobium sp. 192]
MMVRSGNSAARLGTLMSAVLLLLAACGTGWAQSAPPSLGLQEQGPQAAPPPSTPPPAENPGLIHEMGKLFDKLPSILPPIKSPSETMNDLSRLAKPSTMVSGRTACPASSNGAPDCKQAADQLCQSKGYKEGKSLNADSAEKCSAKVLIPGRQRKPDDCRTDTFVTSALCQN